MAILLLATLVYPATRTDNLVRFSELSFQSEYEKLAFEHYQQVDELTLCLATNKTMSPEKAAPLKAKYQKMIDLINKEKLTLKNFRQKYPTVHKIILGSQQLQYADYAEFSDVLNNESYNYITASALFSLVLKENQFSSFLLIFPTKADIIVEPNGDQIILEAQNKNDISGFYNVADNKSFIVNLLDKNIRFGNQMLSNSTGVKVVFQQTDSAALKIKFMAATLYYYKSLQLISSQQNDEAYQFAAKACYLCPNQLFLNNYCMLLKERINNCKFDKVEDMDLLGQLSRFETEDYNKIVSTFKSTVINTVINKDDILFVRAIHERLIPQLNDVTLADDINFYYYMGEAYNNEKTRSANFTPIIEALKLRPDDKYALQLLNIKLNNMVHQTVNPARALDSLNNYEQALSATLVGAEVKKYKLLLYLENAKLFYLHNEPDKGEKYIKMFEETFQPPVTSTDFKVSIENTYYEYARYYVRFNNRAKADKIVEKGLQYVPKSNMIESATYKLINSMPKVIRRKMTKTEYDKYMKKRIIE